MTCKQKYDRIPERKNKERKSEIGNNKRCLKGQPHGWLKCIKLASAAENSWESRLLMTVAGANAHMGYSCVSVRE